jgi:ankyrin repeat protein
MLLAVEGIQVNQANNNESTPLHVACQKDQLKVVEMLLTAKGIGVNYADNKGWTPLNQACASGFKSKVVEMLLAVGDIQVNQANNNGWTPLNVACKRNRSKVVGMLLAAGGIQVNQANRYNNTPLQTACGEGHIDIVIQFLQHGFGHNNIIEWFGINKIDPSGRIALYKYALPLPQQHQPLLDFHLCVLNVQHSQNALAPTSALKVFKTIWPPLIGFTVESFLLPTKPTRRTMQHVVSCFNATLNDHDEQEHTQLYRAAVSADVEAVRFLLLQEGILINAVSREVLSVGVGSIICWSTPLYRAEQCVVGAATTEGHYSDDEISRLNEIVELLRDAGGTSAQNFHGW